MKHRFTGMPTFWVTWSGLVASFTTSGLTRFGLSVWVYQETRDAQAFALLLLFGIIPLSIGSPVRWWCRVDWWLGRASCAAMAGVRPASPCDNQRI